MSGLVSAAWRLLREEGITSLLREGTFWLIEQTLRTYARITGKQHQGEPVFGRNWDVLIILDACRVDLMEEVASTGEYPFLSNRSTIRSLGSNSEEWIRRNFTSAYSKEMAETAYITANLYSKFEIDANQFALLDEVWRYGWDDEVGTTPPRPVTDRAISTMRETNPDRMIVHYMQPHAPFLTDDIDYRRFSKNKALQYWGGRDAPKPIWKAMRDGQFERSSVWNAYRETLETVLDDITVLLENIDADTVAITADHGNALGEKYIYGHPSGIVLDCLRQVPWIETNASDTGKYTPTTNPASTDLEESTVTERLQRLGYK